jgi:hypothetical protein
LYGRSFAYQVIQDSLDLYQKEYVNLINS